jgi:hypothetical protein
LLLNTGTESNCPGKGRTDCTCNISSGDVTKFAWTRAKESNKGNIILGNFFQKTLIFLEKCQVVNDQIGNNPNQISSLV